MEQQQEKKPCDRCGTFEECYNDKCTCLCHTIGTREYISIEKYQEKVELFEKELERIKKVLPRYYSILIIKYKEIFSR